MDINFCSRCGRPMEEKIPVDDTLARAVCTRCGHVHYENPRMVVGTIPVFGDQVLLCQRDIEPRRGKWTLPAGYLENKESVQDGASRETLEETRAKVRIIAPYRLFNILFVDQIYMMFRAELLTNNFGPTSESSQVRLFREEDIPWDQIAFDVISHTLKDYFKDRAWASRTLSNGEQDLYPFKVKDLVFFQGRKIL